MPELPLAPDDAARLHMAVRTNPMVIVVVLSLAAPLDDAALVARLEDPSVLPPVFRQRIVERGLGFGGARWEGDPEFAVRRHVHTIAAAARSLESIAGEVTSLTLPRERPLWDIHVLTGGRDAMIFRAHHALTDGAGLLRVLARLCDDAPHAISAGAATAAASAPHTTRHALVRRVGRVLLGAPTAAALVLRRPDPPGPLHPRLSGRKRIALSGPLEVDVVVERAHRAGVGTIAWMLGAVAGVLRACFGAPARGAVHALVPVPVPTHVAPGEAQNHFASVFVALPVGEPDHDTRAVEIDRHLARARRRAPAAARVARAAGLLSGVVERLGVRLLSRRASVMVSNVRGPERLLRLSGIVVTDIVAFAPAPGRVALGITFMSYAGRLRAGVAVDASVPVDPQEIAAQLERELLPLPPGPERA